MISIQLDWNVLIGLVVTVVLGFGVGFLVRHVGDSIGPLPPPSIETANQWAILVAQKTGGSWIGHVERPIFFASLWIPSAWTPVSANTNKAWGSAPRRFRCWLPKRAATNAAIPSSACSPSNEPDSRSAVNPNRAAITIPDA